MTRAATPLPVRSLAWARCSQDISLTHTLTSVCSGQLLQLRMQGKAAPLPSGVPGPSALPRVDTSVAAHMLMPSPTAGHRE